MPFTAKRKFPIPSRKARVIRLHVMRALHCLRIGERQVTFIWALVIGIVGAAMALLFEETVEAIQWALTGIWSTSRVGTFSQIDDTWRIIVPAIGGLLAGFTLIFLRKRLPGQATEYMEALSIGNGIIRFRASLLKVLAAAFSIASGAAIGKEGPVIQSSALIASSIGQKLKMSTPRLRLIVACGAAAGFTTAFHTPFAGCLFVSEVIIGTVSMDMLAPILISSCTSYLLLNWMGDQAPLYQSSFESFGSLNEILLCTLLGIISALAAKGWVGLLKISHKYLNGQPTWLPARLAAAGLLVGLLACFYPEVVGNGQEIISGLVNEQFSPEQASIFLVVKVVAVAVVFGCGTVGGAMTPTLLIGCIIGFLYSNVLHSLGLAGNHEVAYAMVGLAAFFATAASAPLTALVMVVEFSLNGTMIYPLMIAVVSSYGTGKLIGTRSMYHDLLSKSPEAAIRKPMKKVTLMDVERKSVPTVSPDAPLDQVVNLILHNPGSNIFVVGTARKYVGTIVPSDVISHTRNHPDDTETTAKEFIRTNFPVLHTTMKLPDALEVFEERHLDSIPVTDPETGRLSGLIYKPELFQVITEIMKREQMATIQ